MVLAILAWGAKVLGPLIEFNDPADAGGDYGILALLILFVIVVVVVYFRTRAFINADSNQR